MKRKTIIWMGLITLFGFSLLGWLLIALTSETTLPGLFTKGWPWYLQFPLGMIYGIAAAIIGLAIINSNLLSDVRQFYYKLILQMELKKTDIVFISLCAGIGEEMLFRGALQPWMQELTGHHTGIWITSFIFVAIHGYLNPLNLKLSLYGLFMSFVITGMGYLYFYTGMITVMAAHFAIDLLLLLKINTTGNQAEDAILST